MESKEPAAPKHDLEAAIRRMTVCRPSWFQQPAYIAAHQNRLNQWVLCVYRPTTHYKPDEQYEEQVARPAYWWWLIRPMLNEQHDLMLLLENVQINPLYVAVDHVGDAILEPDLTTLNIYDLNKE